jgi:pilus assembly protein TadC
VIAALAALLAALGIGLWSGQPARAGDRLRSVGPGLTRAAPSPARTRSLRRWRARGDSAAANSTALALAVDLMSACLEAGVPLPAALAAAATVAGDPAADALAATASALRRGADGAAWAGCEGNPQLAGVVRICRRVGTTGAAVADDLRRLAAELRRAHQADRRRRAQRAAVWVVLPLGLCFLPAFLLLTVVPVVVALLPGLH